MKMTMDRDFYLPRDTTSIRSITVEDAVIYRYEMGNKPRALAFHGKAKKPDFHYTFRNTEDREKHIAKYIEGRKAHVAYKAARKTPHTLKVGDILVCSWGYDQTNIDFYQVTRIPGPMSVEIRAIASESGPEDGFMTAIKTAVKDAFTGKPMIKKCNADNWVRIASYAGAGKWDGKPERYSWYA